MVIYDAPRAEDEPPGQARYLAYWKDLAADEVFVYGHVIEKRSDLVHALLSMRHDFGIDAHDLSPDAFPVDLPDADPTDPAAPRAWYTATRKNVMIIAGLWRPEDVDAAAETVAGVIVVGPPPCLPCAAATAGGDAGALDPPSADVYEAAVMLACFCCGGPECPNCDDGIRCTSDWCEVECNTAYCVHQGRNCNDGNQCTNDSCQPSTGACVHISKNCNDGNVCTADSCSPSTGACQNPPRCAGGKCCPAGTNYFCAPAGGVCCSNPDHPCDAGETCCGAGCCEAGAGCCNGDCRQACETTCCDAGWFKGECCGSTGSGCGLNEICCGGCCGGECLEASCVGGQCVTTPACEDDNPCTADICTRETCGDFTCANPPFPDGTGCPPDGDPCTLDECAQGVCTHPPESDGTWCTDDGSDCTDDYCMGGVCTHPPGNEGGACPPDESDCTDDYCAGGECVHPFICGGGETAEAEICCGGTVCCPALNCCPSGFCCPFLCDACITNGFLSGGTITVNPNPACVNDTITFTLNGVMDNAGTKRENCQIVSDGPGTLTYTWTLSVPAGYPPPLPSLTGSGAGASVEAKAPGTYSCEFTATANRDCPPTDRTIGPTTRDAFGDSTCPDCATATASTLTVTEAALATACTGYGRTVEPKAATQVVVIETCVDNGSCHIEFRVTANRDMESDPCPGNYTHVSGGGDPTVTPANFCGMANGFWNGGVANANSGNFRIGGTAYGNTVGVELHEDAHVAEYVLLLNNELAPLLNSASMAPIPMDGNPPSQSCAQAESARTAAITADVNTAYETATINWDALGEGQTHITPSSRTTKALQDRFANGPRTRLQLTLTRARHVPAGRWV